MSSMSTIQVSRMIFDKRVRQSVKWKLAKKMIEKENALHTLIGWIVFDE